MQACYLTLKITTKNYITEKGLNVKELCQMLSNIFLRKCVYFPFVRVGLSLTAADVDTTAPLCSHCSITVLFIQ